MIQRMLILTAVAVAVLSNLDFSPVKNRDLAIDSIKPIKVVQKDSILTVSKQKNKQIKVAIIDTGIAPYVKEKLGCSSGHFDFTGMGLNDNHGHGTHVSGLIYINSKQKDTSKVCQIYLKFFDPTIKPRQNFLINMKKALKMAMDLKVDIINISGGGSEFDSEERDLIKQLLDNGVIIVAAAGNEGGDISDNSKKRYYPASYDTRVVAVGNRTNLNVRAPSSNYGGNVVHWEKGENVVSFGLKPKTTATMTGTSQSAAIKTGKIIREMLDNEGN